MHHEPAYTKISANSGVDQGWSLILSSGLCWQTSADCMTQLPNSLPTWTTGTLIQRDATSTLFFLPLKLGGLGIGSVVQHAAGPWRAWQSVIPTLMATTQFPDTDTLFNTAPQLRAQLVQLQTTFLLQMNKPAFLLKPLGSALRQKATQKKRVTTIQRHFYKQLFDSLTDTPVDRAVLLSQFTSHTGSHLMQPSSEACEVEDRCFRLAVAMRLRFSPQESDTDPTSSVWPISCGHPPRSK